MEQEIQPFDQFWQAWPRHFRKTAKNKCAAKWKKNKLDGQVEHVLTVLEAWKVRWAKDGNKYVPAPLVWLNGERYDCELEDLPGKRDTKVNPIAKQIAKTHNVTYGVDTPRAQEMMQADPPFERTKKLRAVQKLTGNAKMIVWKAYLWLAEQERTTNKKG